MHEARYIRIVLSLLIRTLQGILFVLWCEVLVGVVAFAGQSIGLRSALAVSTLTLSRHVQPTAELAQGTFLVASRSLGDPNFSETVILVLAYDRHGAMGVIINRPTQVTLSMVLPELEGLPRGKEAVYLGGPVSVDQMLLLLRSATRPEDAHQVFADIYASASRTLLRKTTEDAGASMRVYVGYAGWAPGQLEQEVSRGDWHVTTAEAEMIFDRAPAEIWPALIGRTAVQWTGVQELDEDDTTDERVSR